jgi:hypothetical protein
VDWRFWFNALQFIESQTVQLGRYGLESNTWSEMISVASERNRWGQVRNLPRSGEEVERDRVTGDVILESRTKRFLQQVPLAV